SLATDHRIKKIRLVENAEGVALRAAGSVDVALLHAIGRADKCRAVGVIYPPHRQALVAKVVLWTKTGDHGTAVDLPSTDTQVLGGGKSCQVLVGEGRRLACHPVDQARGLFRGGAVEAGMVVTPLMGLPRGKPQAVQELPPGSAYQGDAVEGL